MREAKVIFLKGPTKFQFSCGRRLVADDLDVARVAAAEPLLVGQADELDRERVEAHQLGRHRVDGHLVVRSPGSRS